MGPWEGDLPVLMERGGNFAAAAKTVALFDNVNEFRRFPIE